MKIKSIRIKNFRSYKDETIVSLENLTAFVGKNDVGKSSVLEALDIFFNEGTGAVKLDKEDVNVECRAAEDCNTEITVSFCELPPSVIIDDTTTTTLANEYLLDSEGLLTIKKVYKNAGKPSIYIIANHPTNPECNNLLQKKQTDLARMVTTLGVECEDRRVNAYMRTAIWNHYRTTLQLNIIELDVSSKDGDIKAIWGKLEAMLPCYTLFQSDRKNSDGDTEVQDPLRFAVKQILSTPDIKTKLEEVAQTVQSSLQSVSDSTLAKLREMNPDLASSLHPNIDVEGLKWSDVFKGISIAGDNDIPINKRGSGVKRLVLLNFFRAESERKGAAQGVSVIYAIEEPETSQHKEHQKMLVASLLTLASRPGTQILITTHSADIVKKLGFSNIRLILNNATGNKEVRMVDEQILPLPSLNEVNYLAFGDINEEFHNELYGYLQSEAISEDSNNSSETGFDGWLQAKGCATMKVWQKEMRDGTIRAFNFTIQTYIRNKIHHPENVYNTGYIDAELKQSIEEMANIARTLH
jgi:AAA15 family ATPase/GTPase